MPSGRPTIYTDELAATICERIADGESLRSICRDENMPARASVFKWLKDVGGFSDQYARAREEQADALFEELLEIADDASNDWMRRQSENNEGWVLNGEHVQRSRLRVDTRKWALSKMLPKKYGEKLRQEVEHTGKGGGPIENSHTHSWDPGQLADLPTAELSRLFSEATRK